MDCLKFNENIRQFSILEAGLGTMTNHQAKIKVKSDAQPCFNKARPVPYALRNKVEAELDKLVEQGVLIPVSHSNWAAPIVVVPKSDKSIWICGDYKTTINPVLDVDKYPLPNPQDLFSTLAGGCCFTKLDLSQAYQQMTLFSLAATSLHHPFVSGREEGIFAPPSNIKVDTKSLPLPGMHLHCAAIQIAIFLVTFRVNVWLKFSYGKVLFFKLAYYKVIL